MTSSLVGSEMCIRDSSFVEERGATRDFDQNDVVKEVTTAPLCTTCGKEPVSYTHLTLPTICSV
eukprot:8472785-Prorocentrum_lima.AAC.1